LFNLRSTFYLFFLLLIIFVFISPQSSDAQVESVFSNIISIGRGVIIDENQANARNEAINNAMRIAIEHAVNLIIDSERIANNYELLKEEIFEKSMRYIQSYKIFYESPDISLNIYEVGLQVMVPMGNLKSDLIAIGIIEKRKHRPRMMVVVEEETDIQSKGNGEKPTMSEIALIQNFSESGFDLVDQVAIRKGLKREQIVQAVAGNNRAAAAMGLQFGADIIILGKAVVKERVKSGIDTYQKFVQANISARALDVNTGSIISIGSEYTISSIEERTDTDIYSQLIKETCRKLSRYFVDKFNIISPEKRDEFAKIYLTIENINVSQLSVLRNILKNEVPGILSFLQKSYITKVAQIEVEFAGDIESLINEIVVKNYGTFQIKISSFIENKIHLQVIL